MFLHILISVDWVLLLEMGSSWIPSLGKHPLLILSISYIINNFYIFYINLLYHIFQQKTLNNLRVFCILVFFICIQYKYHLGSEHQLGLITSIHLKTFSSKALSFIKKQENLSILNFSAWL